jgi:hypothetical protein
VRSACGGEVVVAGEFGDEAVEGFGTGVVFDEEIDPASLLGPGSVAVGSDELAVMMGALSFGPPGVEGAVGGFAGVAGEGGEDAVDAKEVGQPGVGG